MNKTVIIINGQGGVGKDTLVKIVQKHYNAINVSSIDPIKEIARQCGWNGEKDEKSRKFLADLKALTIEYSNYPTAYLFSKFIDFIRDIKNEYMFMHIREPEEIDQIKNRIKSDYPDMKVYTLLIRRELAEKQFNNSSDNNVFNYEYDFTYDNNATLDLIEGSWLYYFGTHIKNGE